jgi:hypothetical protein
VFYRFLYRVALWWSFLWKTSRLDLQLDAAHPDGSGGLGFLGLSLRAFREAAFAISASFAGGLANIVLLMGTRVSSYMSEILALVIISMGIFAGPLFFFYRLLVGMKIRDTLEYWVLWQGQLRQFEKNWMRNFAEFPDMLSVADFSEATDLSQILERVQQTRHVPMTTRQIQPLLIAAVLPFVVVMTLEYPVDEMIRQISKIAF